MMKKEELHRIIEKGKEEYYIIAQWCSQWSSMGFEVVYAVCISRNGRSESAFALWASADKRTSFVQTQEI